MSNIFAKPCARSHARMHDAIPSCMVLYTMRATSLALAALLCLPLAACTSDDKGTSGDSTSNTSQTTNYSYDQSQNGQGNSGRRIYRGGHGRSDSNGPGQQAG